MKVIDVVFIPTLLLAMHIPNPVTMQAPGYYSDSSAVLEQSHATTTSKEYYISNLPPSMYYGYSHCHNHQLHNKDFTWECSCRVQPVEETFLHQILTGKGYKNDCVSFRQPVKLENFHEYTCCYANLPPPPSYTGYPAPQ